jgi:hypothetical protein
MWGVGVVAIILLVLGYLGQIYIKIPTYRPVGIKIFALFYEEKNVKRKNIAPHFT